MEIDKFDNVCYIMFPELYNKGMEIYEIKPEIIKVNDNEEYKTYTLKIEDTIFKGIIFDIIIYNDDKYNIFKKVQKFNITNGISGLFSFNKEDILKHYEKMLIDSRNRLDKKLEELNRSIKIIENQKHVLYTKSETLFVKSYV